ncbi:MAG: trypsin-like peptidase domain-containing protein [Fimbriimonadaceae bacterium]|nr:trypsin-like peptidase domain-containing protein [Fimbriimonadaceae bacterium]
MPGLLAAVVAAGQVTPAKPSSLQGVWSDPTVPTEARVALAERSVPLYPGETIIGIKEVGDSNFVPTGDWAAIARFVAGARGLSYIAQVRDKAGQIAEVLVRAEPGARTATPKPVEPVVKPGETSGRFSAEEIFRDLRDRVVIVRTDSAQGTGFVVGSSNLVATCAHMLEDAMEIGIAFADGTTRTPRAVAIDEGTDLAILEFADIVAARPVPIRQTGETAIGATTYVIGHPLGLSFTISNGIVSALRQEKGVSEVQFTAPISVGNSGSPLLDDQGRAIGVVSKLRESGQNLNFATSARHLEELLARPRTPLAAFLASRPARNTKVPPVDPEAASSAIGRLLDRLFTLAVEWDIARRRGEGVEAAEGFVERFDRSCDDEIESGDLIRPFVGSGTETWKAVLAWVLDVRTRVRSLARERATGSREAFSGLYAEVLRPLSRFKDEAWFRADRVVSRLGGLREAVVLSPEFLPDPNARARCVVAWASPSSELRSGDRIMAILVGPGDERAVNGWRDLATLAGPRSAALVVLREGVRVVARVSMGPGS